MNTKFPKKIADNVTLFSSDPIIYVVDDFISEDECQEFINCSKDKLQPATVVGLKEELKLKDRTNEFAWLEHHANESIHEVSKRLSILVQMPIRNAEMFQVVHYESGTEYKPHFDSFDQSTELGKKYWEPGGQRMITALIYLNDVEDGGELIFLSSTYPLIQKKVMYWFSITLSLRPLTLTHAHFMQECQLLVVKNGQPIYGSERTFVTSYLIFRELWLVTILKR